jgi:predicted nucleic acid-binding protein
MSNIFWDTNLFIYLVEQYGDLTARVERLARRMLQRNDQLYTSALTLGEVLVKPELVGSRTLARKYEALLGRHAVIVPFDHEAARIYATVRCDRSIKAPDGIQLACAAKAQVDLFITNDDRLSNKVVPGIQFIVPLSQAFL